MAIDRQSFQKIFSGYMFSNDNTVLFVQCRISVAIDQGKVKHMQEAPVHVPNLIFQKPRMALRVNNNRPFGLRTDSKKIFGLRNTFFSTGAKSIGSINSRPPIFPISDRGLRKAVNILRICMKPIIAQLKMNVLINQHTNAHSHRQAQNVDGRIKLMPEQNAGADFEVASKHGRIGW